MRVPSLPVALGLLVVALAGCSTDDEPGSGGGTPDLPSDSSITTASEGDRSVVMTDDAFQDGNITVANGTRVVYRNEGMHGHTVTIHWVGDAATTLKMDETVPPGSEADYTFSAPGTYHVWCRLHGTMMSGMASVVTVE